jgi:hypothetical protein
MERTNVYIVHLQAATHYHPVSGLWVLPKEGDLVKRVMVTLKDSQHHPVTVSLFIADQVHHWTMQTDSLIIPITCNMLRLGYHSAGIKLTTATGVDVNMNIIVSAVYQRLGDKNERIRLALTGPLYWLEEDNITTGTSLTNVGAMPHCTEEGI